LKNGSYNHLNFPCRTTCAEAATARRARRAARPRWTTRPSKRRNAVQRVKAREGALRQCGRRSGDRELRWPRKLRAAEKRLGNR
jgi:hypothetical protein